MIVRKLNKLFDRKIKYNQAKTDMMGAYTLKLEEQAIETCTTAISHILDNLLELVCTYDAITLVLTTLGDLYRYKVAFLS